jgi:hemerythrin
MGDAFLNWQETYAVGHLGLDLEHKRLVELINEISGVRMGAAGLQQLARLSNALYFAAVEHFRHENSVMRDLIEGAYLLPADGAQHPAISETTINDHCAEHAQALISLERMLQTFTPAKGGSTLASELRIWFPITPLAMMPI